MNTLKKISNSYLNNDQLFINWYLLFSIYAPIVVDYTNEERDDDNLLLRKNNNSRCSNIINRKQRVVSDRTCRILTNSEFLNLDKDFLIYCFLLQKLNKKITNEKITCSDLWIDVSLKEIKDFFKIKKFNNERYGHIFKSCLRRLCNINLELDIASENKVLYTNLVSEIVYEKGKSAKTTYKVYFPLNLIKFLSKSKRETYFTLDEYTSIKTFGARKLYFYFNSIDYNNNGFIINEFKRSTLEQILGHRINYFNIDNLSIIESYQKNKDISKSDISNYLNSLLECDFLESWCYNEVSDNYHVFQKRHLINNDKENELSELDLITKEQFEKSVIKSSIEISEKEIEDAVDELYDFLNSENPIDAREEWEKFENLDSNDTVEIDFNNI
ncbi:MAG: hypothetical protein ACPGR2_13730 [Psychrobium sp.]